MARHRRRRSHAGVERLEPRRLLAVLYWDPDGDRANNNLATGAGLGGSGVWADGGAAVWFNPALNNGAGAYASWNSAAGNTAVFAGPAGGTVTITGGVGAAAVEFRGAGYVFSGGGFNVAAAGTTFTATVAARFDTPIAGSGGIMKDGAATLTLGAAVNTYLGDTTLTAGTLDVRGTIRSHVKPNGGSVQGVMFYDPDLAAAVREALGVDPNAWLTSTLLAQSPAITTLTLNSHLVGDLTGIASLTTLTTFAVIPADYAYSAPGFTTLAPLTGLDNLTTLSLHDVGLTNSVLDTLPALPALTSLDVRYNALASVPASVATRPRLGSLRVHGNPLISENPRAALAALKGKAIDVDVAPDRPETATDVGDLAARLYYLPLKMLEFVTNTIQFQPYAGAMKGPLATLQTKAGNDWDTNSLLAGLYAAAGISVRYVAGVIEVTESQLRDYVGTRDTAAATTMLAAAGLRYDQYANHFKHTWLEAFVNVPTSGQQAWVQLDASWKLRDFRPGVPGVLTSVPFSPLESDYLTNPAWQKKTTADYYEAKVAAWLTQTRPDLTIADVGYDGPIRSQSFPALPAGLPYAVINQPDVASLPTVIPVAEQYKVNIRLADGSTALFGASGVNLTVPDVALSRLTIDPGLAGTGLTQTARPVLRRDGVVVATAPATIANAAATQLALTITVTAPAGGMTYTRTFTRAADRFIAIGLDANQFSESVLTGKRAVANSQQLNQANGATVEIEPAVGGLLDLAIAQYFTAADADEASLAALTSAMPDRTMVALGIATSGPALPATATAGLQFPYLPADMGIDVPANVNGGFAIDATTATVNLSRNLLLGYANSAHEGLILEELTNFESVSTVKAFQLATTATGGLSNLVEINAGNVGSIAALLPGVRADIRTAIANAVTSGLPGVADYAGVTFKALVPKNELAVGVGTDTTKQWRGVGYTLTGVTSDPTKAHLNGKTVGYIIHGAVGTNPLMSYGGAASKVLTPPPSLKPTLPVFNPSFDWGDPVNVATGGVYHEETDVEIPNLGVPLAFGRRYDSIHTVSGQAGSPGPWSDRGMGEGWSFTYSDRLEFNVDGANTATWFTDKGLRLVFTSGAAGYTNPAGVFGTLSGSIATGFTWKDFDGNTTSFGAAVGGYCQLVSKSDRFGNGVAISYVAGTNRIAGVADLRDTKRWISLTYNADARPHVTAVADFTGRQWNYTYLADGRLQTATAPVPAVGAAAPVVRYAYHTDSARRGLLASVTDPAGLATSWEYYANRRAFRVTDTEGLRHSFTYNLFRRQSAFIDERGNASRSSYDDQGNLLDVQQPDRTTERSTWDSRGLKLSFTDAYGATTLYAYDPGSCKVTSVTDPAGNVTTTSYTTGLFRDVDTITRLNRPNDASDDVATKFTYDASGFLTSRIDDFGAARLNVTTTFTLAPGGRGIVQSTTAPRGGVTSFTTSAAGQVLSQSTAVASGNAVTRSNTYDARGNLLSRTDGNGNATTFTYDALGRKTSETSADPDGAGQLPALNASLTYDIAGNLLLTTLSDGRVVRTTFDRRQREVRRTAADGTFSLITYDAAGNKATETDALGRITRYVYDARNRLVATALPDGTTTGLRVDGGGRIVAALDQAGATTAYAYDTLGRKIRETLPDPDGTGPLEPPISARGYDSRGNVQLLTPSFVGQGGVNAGDASWSTHFEYDALGRKTKETQADPDGLGPLTRPVTIFSYDADGNLVIITDPRGFTTTFAYDHLGRKTSETSPDPDGAGPLVPLVKRYVYDGAGNLRFEIAPGGTSETDVAFATEHRYDFLNRRVATIQPDPDGPSGPLLRPTATQTFDGSGRLLTSTDARGSTTDYLYTAVDRVHRVSDALGQWSFSMYDAVGNVVQTIDPAGRRTFTSYDALDRPTSIRSPRPDPTSPTPLTTFAYDVAGNMVQSTDALGRTAWKAYDALGRRTAETSPRGLFAGDPAATTRTIYDAAGRITATIDGLGRRADKVYDSLGRMIREIGPGAGQARPVTHYGYDAAGNLRFTTDPRGFAVNDAGFEQPVLADATFQATPDGTAWAFANSTGVSAGGSGLTAGNQPAPAGAQVLFIQGASAASQTVTNWQAGAYVISFRAAYRANLGATNDFRVLIDTQVVGTFTPSSTSYVSFTTPVFTVGEGDHTICIQGVNSSGGDNTVFIDDIRVEAASPPLLNGSFEQPGLAVGLFRIAPSGSGWSYTASAGVAANGSGFTAGNPAAPSGAQVLFIQGTSSASQDVANWQAGSYVITVNAAKRGNWGSANDFRILIDGQSVGTFTPTSTAYTSFTTAPFTVTTGQHSILLQGVNSTGGDNTVLIDDIRVEAAASPLLNGSFEQPGLAVGSFQIAPSGSGWSYTANAGVSANGSGFTSGSPVAPSGTQVLVIQGVSSASQTIADWQAGSYVISFRAAGRVNWGGINDIRVLVDDQTVGTFKPTTGVYEPYTTAPFTVAAGSHRIRFTGMNSAGGDNTSFIDDVRIAPARLSVSDTGFTTYFFYDALGRQTATVNALGPDWPHTALPDTLPDIVTTHVTRTAYDARGRIASTTDALGQTTDYAYDNLGRKVSETAPAPAAGSARPVTRYAYDASGNMTSVTDPLGNVITYAYDRLDRRTQVTDARGFATITAYDLTGNVTSLTDASGNVTRYAFDRRDRLVTETDPLQAITSYAYDLVGNKTKETDRLGRVSTFVYDAADRLVEERWQASASAAVSHTIKRFYDAADQLLGVTETDTVNPAATTAWQFTYDASGNVVKSRMAPGEIVQTPALDAVPNPPGGLATGDLTIDWDGDGRLERYDGYPITLAVGDQLLLTASSTAFDPVLILQKPTGGLATAFFDDSSGGGTTARLLVTADVAGTWIVVVTSRDELATGAYDLKIAKDQNALVPTALVEYDFTYDKAGNLLTTTEDQAAVAQFGALGPAASGLGLSTSYTLDALNRVTRYEQGVPGAAVTKRVNYAYRADGSVNTVTRFAGEDVNPIGTSAAAYDSMGRLTGITHAPSASPSIAYGYAYDAASRIASMTTPEGTSSFALDATDQLLSASLTAEAYAYDKTGNRTSGGTQIGTGNRLLSDGTYRYAYDAEGNRTAKFLDTNAGGMLSLGDTDVTLYGYDQRNRLVAVSHASAWTATQAAGLAAFSATGTPLPGSDLELRYTYDYADRRIRKSLDADGQAGAGTESVSVAAYAGDVRTLEIARTAPVPGGFLGQVVQRNFYGNGVDEILAVDRITWNGTTPTTSTFWTFTDHQDSVRDIVSGNAADRGQVVEHRQYDSFGKVVRRTTGPQATAPATAGVGVEFAYAGRPFEARTGLSDNRARWYEPATGRFLNEDPSGFKGGDANLFRYVGNDPLNQVDPSGLAAKWASYAGGISTSATTGSAISPLGWSVIGQQAPLAPTTVSPSVSEGVYASLVKKPTQTTPSLLDSIPPTVVPKPAFPYGPLSGWLVNKAEQSKKSGGFLGAVGHMANGTAAAFTSLFDVVVPRTALDLYAAAFCGSGLPSGNRSTSIQTREAAAFAAYVYDRRFDNDGIDAGGLLKTLNIPYNPPPGFQGALFKGQSGTLYWTGRGTQVFSWADWGTNFANQFYGRSEAYDYYKDRLELIDNKVAALGGTLIATGHSMGGGMGIAGSYATGVPAVVFNPAYVHPNYTVGQPGSIQVNVTRGDPLDFFRRSFGAPAQGELHHYSPLPSQGIKHSIQHFHSNP